MINQADEPIGIIVIGAVAILTIALILWQGKRGTSIIDENNPTDGLETMKIALLARLDADIAFIGSLEDWEIQRWRYSKAEELLDVCRDTLKIIDDKDYRAYKVRMEEAMYNGARKRRKT